MSRIQARNWLNDVLVASRSAVPGSYPYNNACGVLYNLGFTSSNLNIFKYRPAGSVNVKDKAAVIINLPNENETVRTHGGILARDKNELKFELDILWIADFSGDVVANTSPTYTDESVSGKHFELLIEGIKKTLRMSVFQKNSSSDIGGINWQLIDSDLNQTSNLVGRDTYINVYQQEAAQDENFQDIFYVATISCCYIEDFNLSGT